jgi:hypothetical protein
MSQPQDFLTTTNYEFFQQKPTLGLVNTSQPQAFSTTTNHESFQQKSTSGLVSTSQPLVCSTVANFRARLTSAHLIFFNSQSHLCAKLTNHRSVQNHPTSGLLNISQPQAFSTTTNNGSFQHQPT